MTNFDAIITQYSNDSQIITSDIGSDTNMLSKKDLKRIQDRSSKRTLYI